MTIIVLLAGVHDAKWPVPAVGPHGGIDGEAQIVLSPFDEVALEMALRIRDGVRSTAIRVFVASGGQRLARQIAALNLPDVELLALGAPWDQRAVAAGLASVAAAADLVVIGREFGDHDGGLVPALLAEILGAPLFARAQVVEARDGIRFTREGERALETVQVEGPLVVSATNDRRTRLRKPLMKNVMMARQLTLPTVQQDASGSPALALVGCAARVPAVREGGCKLLAGSSAQIADALAGLLCEARA